MFHAHRHQQRKRVPASFAKDPGPALAPKMCPNQSQALKDVNDSQAFTVGRKNTFFLNEPLPGIPRHDCKTFSANIRRTHCVRPILSHI